MAARSETAPLVHGDTESLQFETLSFMGDQETVEAGSALAEYIPLTVLHPLQQIRSEYDPEGIAELADRIELVVDKDGRMKFDVIHTPTVGKFDLAGLVAYVQDHSDYYGLPMPPLDSFETHEGYYYLPIAGHRRRLAVMLKCQQNSIPVDTVRLAINPRYNIDFDTAHSLQSRENTSRAVSPIDDAVDIERYYEWQTRRHHGQPPSIAQCARAYGFSRDKIRDALLFVRSPEEIKAYAVENILSYGMVVKLGAIYDAYVLYYVRKHENSSTEPVEYEVAQKNALDETIAFIDTTVIRRIREGIAKKKANEMVGNKLLEVQGLAEYQTGELFLLTEAVPTSKRRRMRRELADTAIDVIGMLAKQNELSSSDIQRIEALLARHAIQKGTDAAVPMF